MLNTAAWKRKTLRIKDELVLDPKNVRLETTTAQVEADIIEDLFENEGAFGLVETIVLVGYLTHEIPIVVVRRGKNVVVEGNRRLAALKAIQNPLLAPGYSARISNLTKALTKAQRDALKSIEVQIAPSQPQADQVVAALHTSSQRRAWTPVRQAAFFQAQIDAGRTYQQLLQRYPTIDVRRFVLRARLINRLKLAVKKDVDLSDFVDGKGFKTSFSTLTRILESKDFGDVTGIDLDSKGNLKTKLAAAQFNAAAVVIVEGMADGSINTRTLNTVKSPRFLQLMAEIRTAAGIPASSSNAPTAGGSGSGKSGPSSNQTSGVSGQGGASGGGAASGSPAKKTATKKAKQQYLATGHISAPSVYPVALVLHLQELSISDIQRFPNSTFLLLRAVLEKSIKSYAEAKGVDIGKTKHNTGRYVQLHQSLAWLVDHFQTNGPKPLIQATKRLQGGKLAIYTTTNDALNAINHNHHFHVDPDEVVQMWNSMDSVMRELMKP